MTRHGGDERFGDEHLDRMRLVGDERADGVARKLLEAHGAGAYDETEVVARAVGRAIRSIARRGDSADDAVREWMEDHSCLPAWADHDAIAAGQRFFTAWPMPIATVLFCAALPTTLAAPHGAAVIAATSRLGDRRHVARRLAGTGRMIFDALSASPAGALRPGRQGYVSVRCVRLLHAVVRQALLAGGDGDWPEAHGTPINQEDLLGTLAAFSVTVVAGLRDLGIPVTRDEAAAYLDAWCVVGALLGIDESLLPRTPEEAERAAARVARRQLGRSAEGRALAEDLFQEMRSAMPPGFRGVPHALTWHLVPTVADLLDVPRPDAVAARAVAAMRRVAGASLAVPPARWAAARPGAFLGRWALDRRMRREHPSGAPAHMADADVLRRAAALDAALHPADLPIDADDVLTIASAGDPMRESGGAIVRRNRGITLAYADLSRRLARAVAGGDDVLDANWCTFATWSSRTIGVHLESIPGTPGEAPVAIDPPARDGRAGGPIAALARRGLRRGNATGLRALAAGNRVVFLEVGLAVSTFLEHFPDRAAAAGDDAEARWSTFWRVVQRHLDALDPAWVLTAVPSANDLRLGFRHYLAALRTDDVEERSQHVLAANIFVAAHEQRRLQGFVQAALAVSSGRAARRLARDRSSGAPGPPARRSCLDAAYARALTWRMPLYLPGEVVRVARPIAGPASAADRWAGMASDEDVSVPALQALVDLYEIGAGAPRRARDWTCFYERMRTIGRLFRLRQRQRALFEGPFGESGL